MKCERLTEEADVFSLAFRRVCEGTSGVSLRSS